MIDRLLGVAFALLVAAGAIFLAVRLIESVAMQLTVISAVVIFVALAALAIRTLWRTNRW